MWINRSHSTNQQENKAENTPVDIQYSAIPYTLLHVEHGNAQFTVLKLGSYVFKNTCIRFYVN